MDGREVSTADGRSVLIRVCFEGEAVQLAVIGKRGGMVEAVSFDSTQLPALIAALQEAGEAAQLDLMATLRRHEVEIDRRRKEALARNPWQNGRPPHA